jgi:hypothetical protein
MADWYYAQGTVQRGPVSIGFITDSLRSGVLKGEDLVWREGLGAWTTADQLPELASAFRVTAPPPPIPHTAAAYRYNMPASPAAMTDHIARASIRSAYSSLAIASMVLGLVAFVLLPLGSFLGIPALICGSIALTGMRRTGAREHWGMAVAGLLLGIFWTIIGALVMGAILLFVANQPAAWDLWCPQTQMAPPPVHAPFFIPNP